MNYIKSMKIMGFKKFRELVVEFDNKMNILVGENESGKSTILEAINIVFSQLYRNADKYIVREFINKENEDEFKKNPSIQNLPSILIEVELDLNPSDPYAQDYYGLNYHNNDKKTSKYGIQFNCKIDPDLVEKLLPIINSGKIPYEYYLFTWSTFHGNSYNIHKKPFNLIFIDNSRVDSNNSFNYYNKSLFINKFNLQDRTDIKHQYNSNFEKMFNELNIDELDEDQRFGINHSKIIFENIISIYDNEIPLENKGKGIENLVKTRISINKKKNKVDVIIIEEPENHLSHTNLKKMLTEIENGSKESQIILSTHNSLIANRLDLKFLLWHQSTKNQMINLRKIPKTVSDFFKRADNNNLIQFLLANKVILVEGTTEYMLIPKIYKDIYNEDIESTGIDIISCHGITFENYLEIAKLSNKKIVVITDNDGNQQKVDDMNKYNQNNNDSQIFMDSNIDNFTWEVCLFNLNEKFLKTIIKIQKNAEYKFNNVVMKDKHLGKMLNNKADVAYDLLVKNPKLIYPKYVRDALEWIKN